MAHKIMGFQVDDPGLSARTCRGHNRHAAGAYGVWFSAVDILDRCMLCGRSDESIDLMLIDTEYASANCILYITIWINIRIYVIGFFKYNVISAINGCIQHLHWPTVNKIQLNTDDLQIPRMWEQRQWFCA